MSPPQLRGWARPCCSYPCPLLKQVAFTWGFVHLQRLELEEMSLTDGEVTGDTKLRGTGKEMPSLCRRNVSLQTASGKREGKLVRRLDTLTLNSSLLKLGLGSVVVNTDIYFFFFPILVISYNFCLPLPSSPAHQLQLSFLSKHL